MSPNGATETMNTTEFSSPMVREEGESAAELIAIVDENDNFVEGRTRREMRRHNLIHRATTCLVANKDLTSIFVHKRSSCKDWCPGRLDVGFGGCVGVNETYAENAERELEEESGLKGLPLTHIGKVFYKGESTVFNDVWVVRYDGNESGLKPQPNEVEYIKAMSVEEVAQGIAANENRFTPDAVLSFGEFLKYLGKKKPGDEKA